MKYRFIFLLTLSCLLIQCDEKKHNPNVGSVDKLFIQARNFGDLFHLVDTIRFWDSDTVLLDYPRSVILDSNRIIWANYDPPIYIFDRSGKYIRCVQNKGRGPKEFLAVTALCKSNKGMFYLFDGVNMRINIYDHKFSFKKSYSLKKGGFKKMVPDNIGNLYVLNEGAFGILEPAVTKYDTLGNITDEWGRIPNTAIMQDMLFGGGIIVDNNNDVYYSYISDFKIWTKSGDDESIKVLKDEPSYYRDVDLQGAEFNVRELAKKSWEITRMNGLYSLAAGYIIQQFFDGNPRKGEKVTIFLEIWDFYGNKVSSGIRPPSQIVAVFENKIVLLMIDNKYKKNFTPILLIYELRSKA